MLLRYCQKILTISLHNPLAVLSDRVSSVSTTIVLDAVGRMEVNRF
jgi:hypothetical protein